MDPANVQNCFVIRKASARNIIYFYQISLGLTSYNYLREFYLNTLIITSLYNKFCRKMHYQSQDLSSGKFQAGRWTPDEHSRFILGVMEFGKDWKKVQEIVRTRNGAQVRSHSQKFFLKLLRIIKDRKKRKYRHISQKTEAETAILQTLDPDLITENTPSQILSLMDYQTSPNTHPKPTEETGHLNRFTKRQLSSFQKYGKNQAKMLQGNTSSQDMKKLLQAYQNLAQQIQDQDQSFLKFVLNQSKGFFSNGHRFSDLIDFGNIALIENKPENMDTQIEPKPRKKSFTLLDQQENQQKLIHALGSLRKKTEDQKHA